MHAPDGVRRVAAPSKTKGAQRKQRLRRGLHRWNLDRQLCAEPTRRIATITLTIAERDPEAAIGRVYRFWAKVRRQWLGTRYFCWLELQARGAVHYHCVWLNPPHVKKVNLIAWVQRAWGSDRTRVRFADGRAGLEHQIDYALNYTKKMGKKAYQQRYDEVPRQLRTFMSQRLEIPPRHLDHAIEGPVWEYVPASYYKGEEVPAELRSTYTATHVVPPGGRCVALDFRRARPAGGGRPRGTNRAPP